MENFELTLNADTVYVDRSFETASWYDKYVLKAGTYPVELRERFGIRYAVVAVDAVLTEKYRVSRLFSASSVQDDRPNTETVHRLQFRPGEIVAGGVRVGEGAGIIRPALTAAA
jgi:hypothetical protein